MTSLLVLFQDTLVGEGGKPMAAEEGIVDIAVLPALRPGSRRANGACFRHPAVTAATGGDYPVLAAAVRKSRKTADVLAGHLLGFSKWEVAVAMVEPAGETPRMRSSASPLPHKPAEWIVDEIAFVRKNV